MDFNISSKLLERMWETVEKTGVAIFRPWVMKRDAKARLHIENLGKLSNIQLEKHASLLKQDLTNTNINIDAIEKISVQDPTFIDVDAKVRKEPYLNIIAHQITENMLQREFQKEINLANTLKVTAEILSQDDSEPPKEQVEHDWINRFREVASNTTTEEIQQLWGRILAGEIKSPGKHSLRTLEFIKNLSTREAKQIERLYSFVICEEYVARSFEGFYDYKNELLNKKLSFDYLIEMQTLGLITGVEAFFALTRKASIAKEVKYHSLYFTKYNEQRNVYIFTHDNPTQELVINACKLTLLGKELHNLCHIEMDADYLNYIVTSLEEQGFKKVPQDKIIF